ncbi:SRPBCC family protein [Dyella telluris]|uniref:SRPBCC family protein n=1 Tax=Dyella telluris TaxID=2763498 RepID=A0A7G8Q3N9_9GAMM|nr:SRPBCC family protein [Dyella telluris]QNK01397.1 SRPBCC family protein [Dyella telluris]
MLQLTGRAHFVRSLWILGWALAGSPAVMASEPHSNTRRFHLDAPCQRVFPLFTAAGEKQWAEGWNPEQLSGSEHRGSAFRTRHPDGQVTTWIVTEYDPVAGRVSYARLAEDSNIGLVDVRCSEEGSGSAIDVTYTLTGLTPKGDAFATKFTTDAHYTAMIDEWRRALVSALSSKP